MTDPAGPAQTGLQQNSDVLTATNQLELTASLLQREALRYSPAGVALCQVLVEHESTQPEMGQERNVRLVIAARFSGVMAEQIATETLGCRLMIRGFICPKRLFRDNKPSGALQIHVTEYQRLGH
ncbi:MAG: primosomal replication protein N [Burkholderiaceae bacterium]